MEGCYNDHLPSSVRGKLLEKVEAVHIREADVENDNVRICRRQLFQSLRCRESTFDGITLL